MLDKCFTKAQSEFLQVCEYVQACAKSILASLDALCMPISVFSKPCIQTVFVKLFTARHVVYMHKRTNIMCH